MSADRRLYRPNVPLGTNGEMATTDDISCNHHWPCERRTLNQPRSGGIGSCFLCPNVVGQRLNTRLGQGSLPETELYLAGPW
jgi:hypothetical protein